MSFASDIQKLKPNFGFAAGCFYFRPAGHILCGFAFESTTSHARILRYAMPLYDRPTDFIALTFSEYLPSAEGRVHEKLVGGRKKVDYFLRCIEPFEEETMRWGTFHYLLGRCRALLGGNDLLIRCEYALTLISAGEYGEAKKQLDILIAHEHASMVPGFTQDMSRLKLELAKEPHLAQLMLDAWEASNRKVLGIV